MNFVHCHKRPIADTARTLVQDPAKTQPLKDFWLAHKLPTEEDSQKEAAESPSDGQAKRNEGQASAGGRTCTRNRAVSTGSALAPLGQALSSHHPALSLPAMLDSFGPLIFPLYKAALLRKRILLVAPAPVELACNFGNSFPQIPFTYTNMYLQCTTSLSFPVSRPLSPISSHSNLYPSACDHSSQQGFTTWLP